MPETPEQTPTSSASTAVNWRKILKPGRYTAKWLILLILVVLATLSHTGHLTLIQNYLEQDPFIWKFGSYEINAYQFLRATLVVVLLFWIAAAISGFGEARINRMTGVRASNRILFIKLLQITIYFIVFLAALDMFGVELKALAVFGGALGIGIGFGLQKITSNFISGIILLMEKSIEADDLIELSDGTNGFIRRTGARFTLLETPDGKEVMIPNEDFITSRVTNWTYSNKRGRAEICIGVSYDSNLELAQKLMLEAANEHPRTSKYPEPSCFLNKFGELAVEFLMYFWVDDVTEGRLQPRSEVMFSIWDKFHANGIKIPLQQRDFIIKHIEAEKK